MQISTALSHSVFAMLVMALGTVATMADEVRRISVNGYELAYVEQGQGEPVVFVHGGLQYYRMWSEQPPTFARHYRAIALVVGTTIPMK